MEGFQSVPVPGGTELAAGALGWAVTEQGLVVGGSGQCVPWSSTIYGSRQEVGMWLQPFASLSCSRQESRPSWHPQTEVGVTMGI